MAQAAQSSAGQGRRGREGGEEAPCLVLRLSPAVRDYECINYFKYNIIQID